MKKKLVLLIFIGIHFSALAQNGYLLSGARSTALGSASVSLSDEWGVIHNQAGLGFVRHASTGFYYKNSFLIKELGARNAILTLPIKTGTLGAAFTNFGYSAYSENKLNLSFAKAFSNSFSMGIAFDYLFTHIAEGNTNFKTLVGEVGILTKLRKNLTLGAHLYNPTRSKTGKNSTERIPTIMQLGLCYQAAEQLMLLVETEKDMGRQPVFKAGIEYQVLSHFFLRTGISSQPFLTSYGVGFQRHQLKIDIGGNYHQTLGFTTQIGFSYSFSKNQETVREHP
ncbi:MAG TPA: hypothetical protein PK289_00875 [Bacteroidia bacterium]|jgi:hypothetical protein|nr:hypothetical protein [Bacteroidia bacterium]HRG51721.1 hypothetical protein [Bacteroidia bacterium]